MAQNVKKPTRRSRKKYPALDPSMNLKSRQDLIDYDYLDKLTEDEKKWLNKFTEEYVNASFNTKKPRSNLHRTKKGRQDCYNRNNRRNSDIFTKAKAMRVLTDCSELDNTEFDKANEDTMIDKVDKKLSE